MTPESIQVARLEEQMNELRRMVNELSETNKVLLRHIDDIREQLATAKGGGRAVMLMISVSGALGAAISWVMSHVRFQ